MKKQSIHAYRFENPSLSRLRMVLTEARRRLPPRVSKKDASEELALRLIRKMQTDYKKELHFTS